MATDFNYALSPAASVLGLGDVLNEQRDDEADEIKRRRLLLEQMKDSINPLGFGAASALGSSVGMAVAGPR